MLDLVVFTAAVVQYANVLLADTRENQLHDDVLDFTHSGTCLNMKTMDGFDADKYAGKWLFAYQTDGGLIGGYKCIQSDYNYNPKVPGLNAKTYGTPILKDNSPVHIYDNFIRSDTKNGEHGSMEKLIRSFQQFEDPKLTLEIPKTIPLNYRGEDGTMEEYIRNIITDDFPKTLHHNYYVLETDYDNYACMYSCSDSVNLKDDLGVVYVRDKSFASIAWHHCSAAFLKNGLDYNHFFTVDQTC